MIYVTLVASLTPNKWIELFEILWWSAQKYKWIEMFFYNSISMCILLWWHLSKQIKYQYLFINSLRLNDMYMHHWTRPSLVQIMACHLFGAKPLYAPVPVYIFKWTPTNSEILIKMNISSLNKIHLKISSLKWWPFFFASVCQVPIWWITISH